MFVERVSDGGVVLVSPVPVSPTVSVPVERVSVSAPGRMPGVVGLKVTLMLQVPWALKLVEQVVVSL